MTRSSRSWSGRGRWLAQPPALEDAELPDRAVAVGRRRRLAFADGSTG